MALEVARNRSEIQQQKRFNRSSKMCKSEQMSFKFRCEQIDRCGVAGVRGE